jgi:hypothetical protein
MKASSIEKRKKVGFVEILIYPVRKKPATHISLFYVIYRGMLYLYGSGVS